MNFKNNLAITLLVFSVISVSYSQETDSKGNLYFQSIQDENSMEPDAGALPVIVFHGINTSCKNFVNKPAFKALSTSPYHNKVYCVEYGADINSILKSISYLTKHACKLVEKYATQYNLNNGKFFNIFTMILTLNRILTLWIFTRLYHCQICSPAVFHGSSCQRNDIVWRTKYGSSKNS